MSKSKVKFKFNSPLLASVLKGSFIAVSVSLILILLFALVIKFANIPDVAIAPVNQGIKIVSIFLGCFFALKKYPQKGLLTGSLIGIIYTFLAFFVFSLLGGTIQFNFTIFIDIVFAIIIGALSGIFSVNKKLRN